ncbi:portal protein, partial [Enterobacter hormaechei]
VHEIVPVVVRRAIEIAYDLHLLETETPIDDLLVRVDVLSPIASALRAQALSTIVEFIQLVGTIRGPQAVELTVKVDEALKEIGLGMGVPAQF